MRGGSISGGPAGDRPRQFSGVLGKARRGDLESLDSLLSFGRRALDAFAARHGPSRKLQGRVDRDDLVQDALVQAWRRLDTFHGRSPAEFVAWLRSILRQQARRQRRNHFVRTMRDVRREETCLVDPPQALSPVPFDATARQAMAAAVDRLPDLERRLVQR